MTVPSSGRNIVCNLDSINKSASYSDRLRLKHLSNLKSAWLEKLYTCVSGWAGACKPLESISSITHSFYGDRVRHPCSENKAKFLGNLGLNIAEARLKEEHHGSASETGTGDTVLVEFAFSHLSLSWFFFTLWFPFLCRVISSTWQQAWYESPSFPTEPSKRGATPGFVYQSQGRTMMGSAELTCLCLYPCTCWQRIKVL